MTGREGFQMQMGLKSTTFVILVGQEKGIRLKRSAALKEKKTGKKHKNSIKYFLEGCLAMKTHVAERETWDPVLKRR